MHQVHMLYTNVHGGKTPIHMEFFNIIIKGKGHREIALLPAGHLNVIFLCDFIVGLILLLFCLCHILALASLKLGRFVQALPPEY